MKERSREGIVWLVVARPEDPVNLDGPGDVLPEMRVLRSSLLACLAS